MQKNTFKIVIAYPPIETDKGVPLLSQNRQFQFFNAPTYIYPMIPAYAATIAKERGYEVVWMDGIAEKKSYKEWLAQLEKEQPDLLLLETKAPVVKMHWKLVNELKEQFKSMDIVMVGDHVTYLPKETLGACKVDYIILTVGTPLMSHIETDLSNIEHVLEIIHPLLRPHQCFILRSTVAPKTTDYVKKFIEKYTKYGRRIALIFVMLVLLFFTNFLVKFYGSYNQLSAEGWQWAYKDIFVSYRVDFENFDHIVVTDHYGQPYIFALYYNAYDPITFRSTLAYNQTRRFATSVVSAFDKYIFTNIDYYNLPSGKSLIFAHPSERMTEIEPKESVYFPNGSLAFIVYEFKK